MDMARIGPDALIALTTDELGFALPDACLPGVTEALATIAHHVRIVEDEA